MWYDQTKGLPDAIVSMTLHKIGPGMDRRGTPMVDRAVILWDGKDGSGYLFAAPAALREMRLDPLIVPVQGRKVPYTATAAGYIGEPGGHSPKGYERTPLPNHLMAFRLTPL